MNLISTLERDFAILIHIHVIVYVGQSVLQVLAEVIEVQLEFLLHGVEHFLTRELATLVSIAVIKNVSQVFLSHLGSFSQLLNTHMF